MPDDEDYYLDCCQCCACVEAAAAASAASEQPTVASSGRRYQVASMALTGETDDTLEVCLNNYEMTEEEEEEEEEDVEVVCHGCHPHKVYKPGR